MNINVYLYNTGVGETDFYNPCTDVTNDGPILSFTDQWGKRHRVYGAWEVIWEKPA